MMIVVAGRKSTGSYSGILLCRKTWAIPQKIDTERSLTGPKACRGPRKGGLDYMKEGSVTVGRAGRLSVHTLDERALGMRETELPPSCMHPPYRSRRVVS